MEGLPDLERWSLLNMTKNLKKDALYPLSEGRGLSAKRNKDKKKETTLGNQDLNSQVVQHLVPHGRWFGGYVQTGKNYSLLSCTIFPSFDEEDFEFGEKQFLLSKYKKHADTLEKFFWCLSRCLDISPR